MNVARMIFGSLDGFMAHFRSNAVGDFGATQRLQEYDDFVRRLPPGDRKRLATQLGDEVVDGVQAIDRDVKFASSAFGTRMRSRCGGGRPESVPCAVAEVRALFSSDLPAALVRAQASSEQLLAKSLDELDRYYEPDSSIN
jgi:hypothetical protein